MPLIRHSCPCQIPNSRQPGEDVNDHATFMARSTGMAGHQARRPATRWQAGWTRPERERLD
jgi:hypothetical protein